jgi:hypothetical protein
MTLSKGNAGAPDCTARSGKRDAKLMKKPSPETVQIPQPGTGEGKLKALGGSPSDDFNTIVSCQVLNALWLDRNPETQQRQYGAAGAALIGLKPADEIEGMLAAQIVATHNAAMECYRRAMLGEQTFEGRRENLNQANKLVRSYATLVEALNRHRGKGQQRVTVEHVHVHQGGQAIVGTVQGGGVSRQTKEQPRAPNAITHAPGIPMRRPDPEGEAMQVAGDAGKAPV